MRIWIAAECMPIQYAARLIKLGSQYQAAVRLVLTIGAHYIGCHGLNLGWNSFSRYEKDHYIMRCIRIYGYMLVFVAL